LQLEQNAVGNLKSLNSPADFPKRPHIFKISGNDMNHNRWRNPKMDYARFAAVIFCKFVNLAGTGSVDTVFKILN
jgi:hypothetical protein